MTDPNQPPARYRWRLTFAKKAPVKYISHLDLVLAWERALRRAGVPLAYSQGFNPRPKMQVASGLPVGTMGTAELMDIIVTQPIDQAETTARIRQALPLGFALQALEEVPLKSPSLQHQLRQAEYRVIVETDLPAEDIAHEISKLLAADKFVQTRRRREEEEEIDLRPWLHELHLEQITGATIQLFMRVTAGQFGNLRPEAVLKALGLADNWAEIERTRLIFEDNLVEPDSPSP